MNVIALFKSASFDAGATHAMGEAFDRACFSLREFGHSDLVHEIIAKRIIAVAKTGVLDTDRLYAQALQAFAPSKPSQTSGEPAEASLQPRIKSRA